MAMLDQAERGRRRRLADTAAGVEPGAWALGLLLVVAAVAAFDGGAVAVSAAARAEVAVAVAGLVVVVGLCAGVLRAPRDRLAWAGVGALAALAAWSAVSISWSIAPDESWLAANRAIAYAVFAGAALVAAASMRDAPTATAIGLTGVALVVALYALGGKLAPELSLGPLGLDPGDRFPRLQEPLDYWNALALLCVMGSPACIWLAAARDVRTGMRIAAFVVLALLLLTAVLSYSRGAILAYAVALGVVVAAGPRRLARLVAGLGAIAATGPAMLVAFARSDLSSGDVPLAERADDGLLLALVLIASLAAAALLARSLIGIEPRLRSNPRVARIATRSLAAGAACLILAGVGALALSDRGLTGQVSHQVSEFKNPEGDLENTPTRLTSVRGSGRYEWWQEAAGAFADRPVAGWGAGSFPLLHFLYREQEAPVRSAHSFPLQLLAESGLIGAVLGIGGIGLLLAAGVRETRLASGRDRLARVALLAAAGAWLVQSLFDWHWEIPGVTLAMLAALCVAAVPRPDLRAARRPLLSPGLAAGGGALVALALIASAALPALSESRRLDALAESGAGRLAEAAEDADMARRLNPLSVQPLITAASIAVQQGDRPRGLLLLREAADLQPENSQPWRRIVNLASVMRQRLVAVEAYRRWAEADPLVVRGIREAVATLSFRLAHPEETSPTAFGTPPP